eukprot:1215208-Rhodomonas_salina.4
MPVRLAGYSCTHTHTPASDTDPHSPRLLCRRHSTLPPSEPPASNIHRARLVASLLHLLSSTSFGFSSYRSSWKSSSSSSSSSSSRSKVVGADAELKRAPPEDKEQGSRDKSGYSTCMMPLRRVTCGCAACHWPVTMG